MTNQRGQCIRCGEVDGHNETCLPRRCWCGRVVVVRQEDNEGYVEGVGYYSECPEHGPDWEQNTLWEERG